MKTRQQRLDEMAIQEHKAVGADNPGGQNKISPQRAMMDGVQDGANQMGRHSIMGKIRSQSQENKNA